MKPNLWRRKPGFYLTSADPKNILYETEHSVLTGYENFVKNYISLTSDTIIAANLSIADLYLIAFRGITGVDLSRNRVRIETKAIQRHLVRFPDEQLYGSNDGRLKTWLRKYSYCYELRVPADHPAPLYPLFLDDLNTFFGQKHGFTASNTKTSMMCLVLAEVSPEAAATLQTKEKTQELAIAIEGWVLALRSKATSYSEIPLISDNGFRIPPDLELAANLQELKELNHALSKYGLKIAPAQRELEMVVIKNIS